MTCIRCGCQGEFQNPDTGIFYVLTNSVGLNQDTGFLTSERCCFCVTCPKGDKGKGCESLASRKKRSKAVPSSVGGELVLLKGHINMERIHAMWRAQELEVNRLYQTIKELFPVAEECKRLQENGPTTPHICTLPKTKCISTDGKCYAEETSNNSIAALEILEPELDVWEAFCAFAKRAFENEVTAKAKIAEAIAASQGKTFAETLIFWENQ